MHQTASNVENIFSAALEIEEPEARSSYLDKVCGDPELRRHVERLLALDPRASGFLESPASAPTLTVESPRPLEGPGTAIGPYRLMEQIGEGGMGVVYVAEQHVPVRRKVALKVIKPGMDTRHVVARFEAERQALAMMDHPNIARIHDGGTTETGRPYFVMELVRGVTITEYCDGERLSIRERLELFVLVCRAVQHAHQKGIIHRDIKPTNVLITLHDGVPVPKVIDFGVAKATGLSLTEKTIYTAFEQLVGTPLYMSPEQAEHSGLDIDTRSDIYSLGVLLYELLTGTTPFDPETLRGAAFDEMRRIIREDEPPTPSTRLSTLGETLTAVSGRRKSDPRRLGPSMRGELDWVVMKALEKDRRRRYETANDLAADVMRHLTDRPVEACPPSAWYRLTKYAHRNRQGLFTAGLAATALLVGTGVSVWQAVRATAAERRAEAALEESRSVIGYLVNDVFGAAAPAKTRGRTLTIHDLLEAGEAVIPARFGRRPLVEAAAREALGRAYDDLGRYTEAAAQFRRVASLRAEFLGRDHPDTLASEALQVRALCPSGLVLACKPLEAEPVARRVLEARRRLLGGDHPQTLASMTALGYVLTRKSFPGYGDRAGRGGPGGRPGPAAGAGGAPRAAVTLLEAAHAGQVRRLGPLNTDALATLDALGQALGSRDDLAGAEAAARRASEGRLRVLGPAHPETLQSLRVLTGVLLRMGRADEAGRTLAEVTEGYRQTFGPTHIQTSSPLHALIDLYGQRGDAAAKRGLCERWLREILASPVDPDPYQRSRRAVVLGFLALNLTTLPAPVRDDAGLAARAAAEAAAVEGGWYGWAMRGAYDCRTGRFAEALNALQTSARQPDWDGGNDFYWFALAVAHARLGDLARADECFERGRDPATKRDTWTEFVDAFRAQAEALIGPKL